MACLVGGCPLLDDDDDDSGGDPLPGTGDGDTDSDADADAGPGDTDTGSTPQDTDTGSAPQDTDTGSTPQDTDTGCAGDEHECLRLTQVEEDLLSLINAERVAHDPPRPELERDPGMDRIMLWHVSRMATEHFLSHYDEHDRESEARAHYYGDDPAVRCSEIIQYWGGSPSGQVHYQGYFDSPPHHSGYLEEPPYDLGPTKWAGLAAVAGTGPAGSQFEGRSGSYTGVMLCESPINLVIDPFFENEAR